MISDADIWRDLQRRIEAVTAALGHAPDPEDEARIITDYAEDQSLPRDRVVQVYRDRITMAGGG